jgi:hypothetical protein
MLCTSPILDPLPSWGKRGVLSAFSRVQTRPTEPTGSRFVVVVLCSDFFAWCLTCISAQSFDRFFSRRDATLYQGMDVPGEIFCLG